MPNIFVICVSSNLANSLKPHSSRLCACVQTAVALQKAQPNFDDIEVNGCDSST